MHITESTERTITLVLSETQANALFDIINYSEEINYETAGIDRDATEDVSNELFQNLQDVGVFGTV